MSEDIQPSHHSVIQPGIPDQTREMLKLPNPTNYLSGCTFEHHFNDHCLTRGEDGIDCTDQSSDAFNTPVLITRTFYAPRTHEPCGSNRCLDSPAPLPHASEDTHRRNSALGFQVEEAHSSTTRFRLERPGMVDSTRTCSVQSTSNSITSLRPINQNGCLSERVGSYLQQSVHRGSLGPTGSKTAYQCIGIEGCLPGPAVVPQPDTSPSSAYPPRDGQYHCSGIPQQERWDPLHNTLRSSPANMGICVEQRILDNGSSHSWSAQCGSRPCIKTVQPSHGVDVRQDDFQEDHSALLCSGNRLVCLSFEPPSTPLYVSGPRPWVDGSRCFSAELGQMEEFYSPASCTSLTHYPEGVAGQGDNTASGSQLARATVVSGFVSDADRSPTAATNQGVAVNPAIPTRDDSPTVAFSAPDSMAHIRKRYQTAGLSSEVIKILLSSWSPATQKRYSAPWNTWAQWCTSHGLCPVSAPVTDVLSFLANLTTQGLEYRTIAVYKSAISQVHDPVGQTTLGNLPIVSRFMKGIFRSTPPKPRLCSVWKVADALNWVSTLEPIETLSLKELTQKLVLLLALTSAARAHELAKLSLDFVSIKTDSWEFFLGSHVKTSRPGHPPRKIYLPAYHKNPSICVVRALNAYKGRTKTLRKSNQLFISVIKPHAEISTQTVSRWLRNALTGAAIDVGFTGHSTRGAATSAAAEAGLSLDIIMAAADWASSTTFEQFYHKPSTRGVFASTVLDNLDGDA